MMTMMTMITMMTRKELSTNRRSRPTLTRCAAGSGVLRQFLALKLLEPRLSTLGQPPALLSIARPGRRVITLMQSPRLLRLLWTPQTSDRSSIMRGSAEGSAGAHVQLRVMAPSSVGRIRLAQRRRCPSRPARAPRTGLYLWLRRDPDMTVLTIRDRLSVVP